MRPHYPKLPDAPIDAENFATMQCRKCGEPVLDHELPRLRWYHNPVIPLTLSVSVMITLLSQTDPGSFAHFAIAVITVAMAVILGMQIERYLSDKNR